MVSYIVRRCDFGMTGTVKSEHVLILRNRSLDDTFAEIYMKCKEKKIRLSFQYEFDHDKVGAYVKNMYPPNMYSYNKIAANRIIFKDSQPSIVVQDPCTPKFDSPRNRRFYTMIGYGTHGYYHRYISDSLNALALERSNKQPLSTLVYSPACYYKPDIPVRQIIKDLPEDCWYLLVIGTYHPHNHFHTVIDAFIHYMRTCKNKPGGYGICIFLGKYNPQNSLHVNYRNSILDHSNYCAYGDHFIFLDLDKQRARLTRSLISQSSCVVYLRENVRYINRDIEEFMRSGTQALLIRFSPEVDFIKDHNCGALVRKPTVLRVAHAIEKAMHPIYYCQHCINARMHYLKYMTKYQLFLNEIEELDRNIPSNDIPFRAAYSWPTTHQELQLRYDNKPFEFDFDESDEEVNYYFQMHEHPSVGYSAFRFDSDWYVASSPTESTLIKLDSDEE